MCIDFLGGISELELFNGDFFTSIIFATVFRVIWKLSDFDIEISFSESCL